MAGRKDARDATDGRVDRGRYAKLRVGYACVNTEAGCTGSSTFRLASFSRERAEATARANLACLLRVLEWNRGHGIMFFRISSDIVPFASHPKAGWDWRSALADELRRIGRFVESHGMRVCMHPDQFVVLDSPRPDVVDASARELDYHCALLDAMRLPRTAKVQIHVGGAYGDRPAALGRFVDEASGLDERIMRRLVVENDERLFTVEDCIRVHGEVGVPIVMDLFHHEVNPGAWDAVAAFEAASGTWRKADGPQMVDYSSQKEGGRKGAHTDTLDEAHFAGTLPLLASREVDLMLEIKDKQASAMRLSKLLTRLG